LKGARRVREAARRNGSIERRDRASGRLHHPQTIPEGPDDPDETGTAGGEPTPDMLSHPTFTGMTTDELTTLTTALDALRAAHRESTHAAYREAVRHNGIRPHAPRSGRPQTFGFPDRVLVTVLRLRLSLPEDTLAHLFTTSRATIRRAVQ
jgi:hypothetical protein